jgi:hypothetical protein
VMESQEQQRGSCGREDAQQNVMEQQSDHM